MNKWQATVKRLAKQGYSGPSLMKAASRAYKKKGGTKAKNPWVRGYKYYRKGKRKTTKVGSYWKPKGTRKSYPKPKARSRASKPRFGTKSYYRWLGKKSAAARRRRAGGRKRAANPRRRRRNPSPRAFTYALSPGSSLANPYVKANPRRRKRRKATTKRRRTTYRRRRRNAPFRYTIPAGVVANPYVKANVFSNPAMSMQMSAKSFVQGFLKPDLWLKQILPLAGGFVGTKVLTGYAIPLIFKKKWESDAAFVSTIKKWKPAIEVGGGIVGGLIIGFATKKADIAAKFAIGGILAGIVSFLDTQQKYTDYADKLDGIGQVSEEMKAKLARAVQQEISAAEGGMDAYDETYANTDDTGWMDGVDETGVAAFATDEDTVGGVSGGITMDQFLAEVVI